MDLDLQKAGIWKRFSAWLCDAVAFVLVFLVISLLLSTVTGYDKRSDIAKDFYEKYEEQYKEQYKKQYGSDFSLSMDEEEFNSLSEDEKNFYDAVLKEMYEDPEWPQVYHAMALLPYYPIMILSISALLASLILEFALPMIFKNGQTLGKKLFGIAVIRTNCVRVTGPVMFIRSILGKCTIEILAPIFIIFMFFNGQLGSVALIVLLLLLVLQISVMIITKTNSAIHDLLADTVTVDFSSQRIFGSEEELIAYKTKVHAERVARDNY